MKNREVWDAVDYYTGEISKNARALGFAGIAVCWFFRNPDLTFPPRILWSLVFIVAFFLADLSQYYVSGMRLRRWMRAEERARRARTGTIEHDDYAIPPRIHRPGHVLFHVKLLCLAGGFFLLGYEFATHL